jgi:hypothetical protein
VKKTWGDIFHAALRRGDDHGYAAYLADEYVKRREKRMTVQTDDLAPGDTVSTIFHTTGLVIKGPVYGGQSWLYWDDQRADVGMLAWTKLALIRRGSPEDVARAERILALHEAQAERSQAQGTV